MADCFWLLNGQDFLQREHKREKKEERERKTKIKKRGRRQIRQ